MSKWKVPVQSLIDHIKTAVDVDQWAKDMAEELLKQQEPAKVRHLHGTKITVHEEIVFTDECENCSSYLLKHWKACPICGKPVKWDADD